MATKLQAMFTDPMVATDYRTGYLDADVVLTSLGTLTVAAVGRSGGTPLTDGIVITDASAETATHQFSFSPRTTTALTFPAVCVRPVTANKQIAFDVMPNGTATPGTNGYAWIDVCDTDVLDAGATAVNTARLSTFSDHVGFESYSTGGATPKPLWFKVPTDGTSGRTQVIKLTPATGGVAAADDYTLTVDPLVILAAHGGSVIAGSGFRLKTAATIGFLNIPTIQAAPTGVPTAGGKTAAVCFLDATSTLYIYNKTAAAWKSVALS